LNGYALAYLLMPVIYWFERVIDRYMVARVEQGRYIVAVVATYICFVLALYLFFSFLMPILIRSVTQFVAQARTYAGVLTEWAVELSEIPYFKDWVNLNEWEINQWFIVRMAEFVNYLTENYPYLIGKTIDVATGVFNLVVSFVVSVYTVMEKNRIASQTKKALHALCKPKQVAVVLKIIRDADMVFGRFIRGNIITSVIIAILYLIGMKVLGLPEAVLVSVVLGITNLIPVVGPFLGGIPCVLFVAVIDPSAAVRLALFIVVMQQVNANILLPRIMGDILGISGLQVIFAVIVFGSLFGLPGMFFGVPAYALLTKEFGDYVNATLGKKNLPQDEDAYMQKEPLIADEELSEG